MYDINIHTVGLSFIYAVSEKYFFDIVEPQKMTAVTLIFVSRKLPSDYEEALYNSTSYTEREIVH